MTSRLATWTGVPVELLIDNHGTGILTVPQKRFPGSVILSGPMGREVVDRISAARRQGEIVEISISLRVLDAGPRAGDACYHVPSNRLGVYRRWVPDAGYEVEVGMDGATETWLPWEVEELEPARRT